MSFEVEKSRICLLKLTEHSKIYIEEVIYIKTLMPIFKKYKFHLTLGPFCKVVEAVFELIIPLVMASLIDEGIKRGEINFILGKGAIILLLVLLGYFTTLITQRLASVAGAKIGYDIREALFKKAMSVSVINTERNSKNHIISVLNNDVNLVVNAVAMGIRFITRIPFIIIGAFIMSAYIDFHISLVFLAVTVFVAILNITIMKYTVPLYTKAAKLLDSLSLTLRENLFGARLVRSFRNKEGENKRFLNDNESYYETIVKSSRVSSLLSPLSFLILNGAIVAILYFGAFGVESGVLTSGEVIAFIGYLNQILVALIIIANISVIFSRGFAAINRIGKILEIEDEIPDKRIKSDKLLSLSNVTFRFPGEKIETLKQMDFEVSDGEDIGIIGVSGSGKSVLAKVIIGQYRGYEGEIHFGGEFSLCETTPSIFKGDIAFNIALDDSIDKTRADEAIKASSCDFVKNLDMEVLQNGRNLSGGMKARLNIARALYKKAKLYIFDDSLTALDNITAKKVRNNLTNICDTLIIISQRVLTVSECKRIVVLDNGCIIADGSHTELLESCSLYRDLAVSQGIEVAK